MKIRRIFFNILFLAALVLSAACDTQKGEIPHDLEGMPVITAAIFLTEVPVLEMADAKQELAAEEREMLDRLCEKAKQLYMVEPMETKDKMTVLVRRLILSEMPGKNDTAGEIVAEYELPYKIHEHNLYNFYYDGEIFAVAEGAYSNDYPEEHNRMLSILVSQNGGEFERIDVGETEYEYQRVYFDFGGNGRIALLTDYGIFTHEVFFRADGASEWRKMGTAESFEKRYNRLADSISFFDETTGIVGTPFVDPWYTNFIRTEDSGENWNFAEKELLEDMPGSAATGECAYSVCSLHCEGNVGAALVRVEGWEADGSYAYYVYTTVDKGKTWQIASKVL